MNRTLTPSQVAGLLLIPSTLIFLAALPLVPWLVETKARLDNSYWETQLAYAAISLCMAALSAPCLILRLCCSAPRVAMAAWCATVLSYLLVLVYFAESHFPP